MENKLEISLETDDYEVLSSGVVMIPKNQKLIINIANLKFIVKIETNDDNKEKSYFVFKPIDETTLELVLFNMSNTVFGSPEKVIALTKELSLLFSIQPSIAGNSTIFIYSFFKNK